MSRLGFSPSDTLVLGTMKIILGKGELKDSYICSKPELSPTGKPTGLIPHLWGSEQF